MRSRILMIGVIATFGIADVFCPKTASTTEWFDGQELLVECPNWHWQASQMPGLVYELCFDDIDHCTVANIGDAVCIPSLGEHDAWVTAIDFQGVDPVYYDGEIAPIRRARSADLDGDGVVGFRDFFVLLDALGETRGGSEDLDDDGMVGLPDLFLAIDSFLKCVSDSGQLYEAC